MNESILKALIEGLEKSRASLDYWLMFWTWLVVIGVLLEVIFVILDHFDALEDWRQGKLNPPFSPSKPKVWRLFIELFGAGLVALGVAGELAIDARIGGIERQIKEANGNRVLILQREAGEAKQSALDAANASRNAITDSAKASDVARLARKEADSFEHDIVAAKKQTAEAESHLADAIERTRRLEVQLSWRIITPDQKAKLLSNLMTSSRRLMPLQGIKISIRYSNSDPEVQEYAYEIKNSLSETGAEITDISGVVEIGVPGYKVPQGVILTLNPHRNPKAYILINAFNEAGIDTSGVANENMNEEEVLIFVGAKKHITSP
jgi:hypothetical protein